MRSLVASLLLFAIALPAMAADKAALDYRIRMLSLKFETMQSKPDKRIPTNQLSKAKGILLLDRTKAGFLFAYQGGSGVAMVRDQKSGDWSAPAFFTATEASLGLQIGGQQSFVVVLLMNTNAVLMLAESSFTFGGEASGTAGNVSGGAEGTIPNDRPLELVYSDTEGLFGGVAVKGGAVSPDTDANLVYYGQYLTAREILFGNKVKPSDVAADLIRTISRFSK